MSKKKDNKKEEKEMVDLNQAPDSKGSKRSARKLKEAQ